MAHGIGASQTPSSEPDRSQPSDGDLPQPFPRTSEEAGLQLVPERLLENIRHRLILGDAPYKIFRSHRHRTCIVGIDQALENLDAVLAFDVDAAFPWNE